MNIPIWVLIAVGLILAISIVRGISLSKELSEAKTSCRNTEASLSEAKQEKELSDVKNRVELLNTLLSQRPTFEEKHSLEQKIATVSALLASFEEQNNIKQLQFQRDIATMNAQIETETHAREKRDRQVNLQLTSLKNVLDPEHDYPIAKHSGTNEELSVRVNDIIELARKVVIELAVYKTFYSNAQSNLTLFPYMAGIVSEFETRDIESLARKLDWGSNLERAKKVASIRAIRHDAQEKINQAKVAEYQLAYLLQMFPSLKDLLEYEYSALPHITAEDLSEYDTTRDFLSKEEWEHLSTTERNQLALDRYVASRKKTNWQVGRDYEEYVGYYFRKRGYSVDNYGVYMGLDDLGRDVIAKKGSKTYVIQCKYWSQKKEIHENHINQLFGTVTSYKIENNTADDSVIGVLVTNTQLSERAKKFAERLHIQFKEHFEIGDFPRIKCNIGHSEWGSRIYHLPFDQQYDAAKICNPGEFYALTVAEAEKAGFRRAFKWHGA